MLVSFRLQNIALIESLDLSFDNGFTVLTGETGAGKSILLDALDSLLGGGSTSHPSRLIRAGSDFAMIEASFTITSQVAVWLKQNSLEDDNTEILITKEWRKNHQRTISRTRVNGIVINRSQLTTLRSFLIDLTVQGQTHQLACPGQQLTWLDRFGSNKINQYISKTKASWKNWKEAKKIYQEEMIKWNKEKENIDQNLLFLKEVELAELDDSEEDIKLKNEQDRLVYGVNLQESLLKIFAYIKEGYDHNPSLIEQFAACIKELQSMSKLDKTLCTLVDEFLNIQVNFHELTKKLEDYGSKMDSDPNQLNTVQERLSILNLLQRKYSLSLPELITRKLEISKILHSSDSNELLLSLEKAEKQARIQMEEHNRALTEIRKEVSITLEESLKRYLILMGLPDIRFKVDLKDSEPSETGADSIQFLFSANPGEDLAPLSDLASGGEMSRFLLAFKTIFSETTDTTTFLFDEIDTGVSGRISVAIAGVLKELGSRCQVFCVTHQPLIAAAADHHFSVSKSVCEGKTHSSVNQLIDIQDRERELADLAGGHAVNAKAYAASLLDQHAA